MKCSNGIRLAYVRMNWTLWKTLCEVARNSKINRRICMFASLTLIFDLYVSLRRNTAVTQKICLSSKSDDLIGPVIVIVMAGEENDLVFFRYFLQKISSIFPAKWVKMYQWIIQNKGK